MKFVKPSFEVLRFPVNCDDDIEQAARTCYKSEDRIEEGSAERLVLSLLERGHHAMLEFGGVATVRFVCDRGVTHELVRHRLCSFAQESTRFCNYSDEKFGEQITVVLPPWVASIEPGEYSADIFRQGFIAPRDVAGVEGRPIRLEHEHEVEWLMALVRAETAYLNLLKLGQTPQQARSVLPNSLKTEIVVQANVREWLHIFEQRCHKAAHPQMRELMIPLSQWFAAHAPTLFGRWSQP